MLDGLKPYPDCKASTLPALGPIPAHWEERRAKYLYKEVDERSTTGTEVLCSVSHKTGVTPRMASVTMFLAESTVGHKICRPNDVVINTLWAWMAALGVAKQVGLVSPAYGVYLNAHVLEIRHGQHTLIESTATRFCPAPACGDLGDRECLDLRRPFLRERPVLLALASGRSFGREHALGHDRRRLWR